MPVNVNNRPGSLRRIPVAEPWQVYLLATSGFPVDEQELKPLRSFCTSLVSVIVLREKLNTETFFQVMQLQNGDASKRVSANGRLWIPMLGLGVWPDRDAPAFWTAEDFTSLREGEQPRTLMHQVLRVTTTPEARTAALEKMLGLGTLVHVLTADTNQEFLQKSTSSLLQPIIDESFRTFPFYIALLEQRSLEGVSSENIDAWLGGARFYLRESAEDSSILIIYRGALDGILESLGARLEREPEPRWILPSYS